MSVEQQATNIPGELELTDSDILETLSLSDTSTSTSTPAATTPSSGAATEPGAADSAPAAPDAPGGKKTETPAAGTEAPSEPAAPAPTEGSPQGADAPSSAPSDHPAAAPTPQSDADRALREASLQATVDALRREVETLRANPPAAQGTTPTAAAAPESGGQPAEEKPFRYSLTLPKATQDALLSDDPQQNILAINTIVNDLGTIVHNNVLTQMRSEVREAFSSLISMANQGQAATSQEAAKEAGRKAYFDAFPAHQNDMIEPIIRAQAVALSAEHPDLPFNAQFINALGARVNGVLEQLGAKPPETGAETAPAADPTKPPKPAAFVGGGAPRPAGAVPNADGNLGDEIAGTLSPF